MQSIKKTRINRKHSVKAHSRKHSAWHRKTVLKCQYPFSDAKTNTYRIALLICIYPFLYFKDFIWQKNSTFSYIIVLNNFLLLIKVGRIQDLLEKKFCFGSFCLVTVKQTDSLSCPHVNVFVIKLFQN